MFKTFYNMVLVYLVVTVTFGKCQLHLFTFNYLPVIFVS